MAQTLLLQSLKKFLDQPEGECWVWEGPTDNGYAHVRLTDRRKKYLHRIMYELFREPIPRGLTLDHLCRVPACVNPAHLEAVTMRVNILRGTNRAAQNSRRTHCPRGHPLIGANLVPWNPNHRRCLTCARAQQAAWMRRKRAEAKSGPIHGPA